MLKALYMMPHVLWQRDVDLNSATKLSCCCTSGGTTAVQQPAVHRQPGNHSQHADAHYCAEKLTMYVAHGLSMAGTSFDKAEL